MIPAQGKIVTFYSYKGGTGRSMALANVAWILASAGRRVLVLDWDLEAPGVHRYFRPFLTDPDLVASNGLIDFVTGYCAWAADQSTLSDEDCRQQVDLDPYMTSLDWSFPGDGGIDFVPAGKQGPEYSTRVNTFDWKRFYEHLRGDLLIATLREKLIAEYEFVLIDSRTGVSDTSGICTLQLPDTLAACFTLNNQSIAGIQDALTSIKKQRDGAKRDLNIFPLPMRIDLGEADRLEVRRKIAREALGVFLNSNVSVPNAYWDSVEVLAVPIYSYEEILAPFRDSGGAGSVLEAYRHITRYLTGITVESKALFLSEEQRSSVLAVFAGMSSDTQGSLAAKAERFYQSLPPPGQDEFRSLVLQLIKLVEPGKDELREVSESELKFSSMMIAARDAGIIRIWTPKMTGDRETRFELGDRSLLWSWPRLVDWISRERKPQVKEAELPVSPVGSRPFNPALWGPLAIRYQQDRPRRMLSLDGGGVRSVVTLQVLHEIERKLSEAMHAGQSFRLCDYFDYIAGTSTGAILAAGLARGMSVSELASFYMQSLPAMFEKNALLSRVKHFYTADPLKLRLMEVFGSTTDLSPQNLKCLLLLVMRNLNTNSPWPLSSNPEAKYNQPSRPDSNLRIPLWQLVRASTAAPVYFPPESIQWDPSDPSKTFNMTDGGSTVYNNPAFLLYRMATAPEYRLSWAQGENRLLIVSVGAGIRTPPVPSSSGNILSQTASLIVNAFDDAAYEQDLNCRSVGRCVFGPVIDREVGAMIPEAPLTSDLGRKFLYVRYNPDLAELGKDQVNDDDFSSAARLEILARGQARAMVDLAHFGSFIQA